MLALRRDMPGTATAFLLNLPLPADRTYRGSRYRRLDTLAVLAVMEGQPHPRFDLPHLACCSNTR